MPDVGKQLGGFAALCQSKFNTSDRVSSLPCKIESLHMLEERNAACYRITADGKHLDFWINPWDLAYIALGALRVKDIKDSDCWRLFNELMAYIVGMLQTKVAGCE
jgi:hypothetical protein